MSTRCNIVVNDRFKEKLWFYRHSDGYPAGVVESLTKFCQWVKEGRIRDNASQACGWLIAIGMEEYADLTHKEELDKLKAEASTFFNPDMSKINLCEPSKGMSGWKVGAYEPTHGKHGDIAYLYEIDLVKRTITCKKADGKEGFTAEFGEAWPGVIVCYGDAKRIAQKAGIRTEQEYDNWKERPFYLPVTPSESYKDRWVDWEAFLNPKGDN